MSYCTRKNREDEQAWKRTREIVFLLFNTNVTSPSDMLTHEELIPLPSDKLSKRESEPQLNKSDAAFFRQLDSLIAVLPTPAHESPETGK